jgi:hypothetical protein
MVDFGDHRQRKGNEEKEMKKAVAAVVPLVVLCGLAFALVQCGPSKEEITQEMIRKLAAEANQGVPRKVNEFTELTGGEAQPGILVYKYRILNVYSSEMTQEQLDELRPLQVQAACNNLGLTHFFARQATLRATYYGREGGRIGDVDVTPSNCGMQRPGE